MTTAPDSGAAYLRRGFAMLNKPGVRLFVAIPLLINVTVFGALMGVTLDYFGDWLDKLMNWLPDWLNFLRWILWPLAVVLLLSVVMYLFSTLANIIASPFNGLLAEKVEELAGGKEIQGRENFAQALASFPRSLFRELRKMLYYLKFAIVVLILSAIFSPAAPVLWFLLGSWMMALQYTDYAMDNNRLSFSVAKSKLQTARGKATGFGILVMVGTMIPVLNLIIMPAAVCGGTLMWLEQMKGSAEQ